MTETCRRHVADTTQNVAVWTKKRHANIRHVELSLIGRNGCGKSTLMKALGARAVPIPAGIDTFHLKEEVEPSDTMTALDAVMSVDEERSRLEREVETRS